jgi:nitrite reductase (NADH) large subunit
MDAPSSPLALPGLKALGVTCLVALGLGYTMLFAKPIPFAESVQAGQRVLDILWRVSWIKQLTGFTVLGLALISVLLSARKRLKRFSWGEFGNWRAFHAILGTVALAALISHTGFRLGQNFNAILMANFLALALIGAGAGAVTAFERRLSARAARQLRRVWTGAHIALAFPLPALVIVHVVMAYYF